MSRLMAAVCGTLCWCVTLSLATGKVNGDVLGDSANQNVLQNESSATSWPLTNVVDRQVAEVMDKYGVPGLSIAVAHNNDLVYAQAYGLADVENAVPLTTSTRFRTASVAKPMTAAVIMSLDERGKIDLDADVMTYCQAFPTKQWPVTPRQLLGHLGGVRHYKDSQEPSSTRHFYSLSAALSTFADDPLMHEPGTKYLYSSFGYNLLGSIAESAGEQAFMSLLHELYNLATSVVDAIQPPQPEQPAHDYSRAIKLLNEAIEYEVELKDIPAFSMALVDDEQVVWSRGFGYQDAERKVPATADTVYRVGSVSKLFTDIAILQLVEAGKLDLDGDIQQYLPDFKPANSHGVPITLRQLMSHRSGLVRESPVGNYFDPSQPTLAETVASLNATALVYPPETKTKYSNAAVAVLGSLLESQLDVSHPAHVRQAILDPLGMQASGFVVNAAMEPKLATGWMWTYDGRRFEAPDFLLGTGPAGNLYSSVSDLSKFLVCLFNDGQASAGQIISPETLKRMATPITNADGKSQGFGLGFHIKDFEGTRLIGHGGAVYGFSTQLEALPSRKIGVAAAASLDGSNGLVRRIAEYGLKLMLATQDGEALPEYQRTTAIAAERAKELTGKFREVDGERFTRISELNGDVFLQRGTYRYNLRALADDGAIVADDPLGFGIEVKRENPSRLLVDGVEYERVADEPPADIPDRWKGLIGEYGWEHNTLYILEEDGKLYSLIEWFYYYPLEEISENVFAFPAAAGLYHGEKLVFSRDASGSATEVVAAEVKFLRREVGTKDGETFKITPVKPIDELRGEALAAEPPPEAGEYRASELVQLVDLDATIELDIRYATENNFTGAVFYKQPRAFMQRPAAEAVARVNERLRPMGLGLLVHDAYRPWHVTKMFWDATPGSMKDFVANPANGSRHNRGCAVDLTLYDLTTGQPIQMVAGYDEFSARSFPNYPGGTERQRWYRDLLRRVMEAEGFTVYEFEWWHFDYRDWKQYRIGNATFEELLSD